MSPWKPLLLALAAAAIATPALAKEPKTPLTFEAIDANHDGKITPAELDAAFKSRPHLAKRGEKPFKHMDRNKDGAVTKDEFDAWMAKRAARKAEKKAQPSGGGKSGG